MLRTLQSFPVFILSAAALFLFSCFADRGASGETEAPADPLDAFALAFNISRADVKEVGKISFGDTGTVSAILFGIYMDKEKYQSGLVTIYPRLNKNYIGEVIKLIPGDSIHFQGILDIKGVPGIVDLSRKKPADTIDGKAGSGMKSPALLLNISKESPLAEDTLFLISVNRSPSVLWQETIRSIRADGGGYKTIRMQLEQGEDEYLAVRLIQTTLPGKGAAPYRPGPPLSRIFKIKDGTYQRFTK
ncbi:MAG: hypothetical protein AB1499_14700 [Nitrospirota bacterium]